MSDKSLVSVFSQAPAATQNTFASENFNTVLYTGTGATQRIGGYINRGAVFNGSSSYIDTGFSTLGPYFSVSMWINEDSLGSGAFFGNWNSTSADDFYLQVTTAGKLRVGADGAGTEFFGSDGDISVSTWHHICVTFDNGSIEAYLDGTSLGTTTTANTDFTSGRNFVIGATSTASNADYFNGAIDQFRLFDKALSSSEVTTLSNETHASTTKGTTDIFGDRSALLLYQLDGNANDTGGVSGKYGSAAIFNGSSSGITNGDIAVNTSNNWSVSFWAYSNKDSAYQRMVQFGSGNTNFIIQKRGDNNKVRLFSEVSGGTKFDIDGAVLNTTGWNHIVATGDGTTAKLYVNNATAVTDTIDGTSNMSGLYIGKRDTSAEYFDGRIDDLRIYSDVLTSTEVGYIYNNTTASIPTDNLVAHYTFDGHSRDVSSAPQYDGVASNVKYAYDGTASNITYQEATKFSPDLVWIKERNGTDHHRLQDSVRGAGYRIYSSATSAEGYASDSITSFDSTGFSLGSSAAVNQSTLNYVAWCWNAGTASAASNTDGSITSTVKANTAAGFSIVKWTGTEANATIGHGLESAPQMIIIKNASAAKNWTVYAEPVGATHYAKLNLTDAFQDADTAFNDTAPTSDVFSVGSASVANGSGNTMIAYCFHSVDGYQKVGSYTGTGTANNIIETGFEPAWLMIKRTDSTSRWRIVDNKRNTENPRNTNLFAEDNIAETSGNTQEFNFLSNGFEIPDNQDADLNASGGTFIYLAIAADPDETTPTVENSFDVVTYTGNGSTQSIETDFKPDLVWVKERTTAEGHRLYDSIRGVHKHLNSENTGAEATNTAGLTSFDEGGFSIGSYAPVNTNNEDYVAWCWKAGDHDDNLPEINTNGTIDSTVSVNDSAGFSIVKYTGNGTAGATIGHGLSSTPQMIIIKNLDSTANWAVYTETTGTNATLLLNSTSASVSVSNKYAGTNSTVFGVNSASDVNTSGKEYIAYCWYSVSGHSKIGSYTGNGSDTGPTVTTGFRPRFLMVKATDIAKDWRIMDSQRDYDSSTGITQASLNANTNTAEATGTDRVKFTSTGFQIVTGSQGWNNDGSTYIYMAFK